MPENGIIQVDGDHLVRPDGSPVVLRGVGLGGWMNMENFITGYPGTESQQRRVLRAPLAAAGPGAAGRARRGGLPAVLRPVPRRLLRRRRRAVPRLARPQLRADPVLL